MPGSIPFSGTQIMWRSAALDLEVRCIVVALGGSATNDGGAGAIQALGAELRGAPCPARARDLANVTSVDLSAVDPRLSAIELVALCDVDSPLTGPEGATRVFGPQKGLGPTDTLLLDRALDHFASHFNSDPRARGSGAAGGLGFGLAAAVGARLVGGADYVLDNVGFDARASRAAWYSPPKAGSTSEPRGQARRAGGRARRTPRDPRRRAGRSPGRSIAPARRARHRGGPRTLGRACPSQSPWREPANCSSGRQSAPFETSTPDRLTYRAPARPAPGARRAWVGCVRLEARSDASPPPAPIRPQPTPDS